MKRTILTALMLILTLAVRGQVANFTAAVNSGCSPLIVNFQDQSIGQITAWNWDFGNGATSTLRNPSTTYFSAGTYTVSLTITTTQGTKTLVRNQYITVYAAPKVDFKTADTIGCMPLQSHFTDLSTAAPGTVNTGWMWNFGDGSTSTQQNPVKDYSQAGGIFSVTLKVTNDKGCYDIKTRNDYIEAIPIRKPELNFMLPTICKPPFTINFTSPSTGLTYNWFFGDGANTATVKGAVSHTYITGGNYTVKLAVTDKNGCADTVSQSTVLKIPDLPVLKITPVNICANTPTAFQNSTPAPLSSKWDFGDGTTSADIAPLKTYSKNGAYTVKLTNDYGICQDSALQLITVASLPVPQFSHKEVSTCGQPLKVNFTNTSALSLSYVWDFGDGTTSTAINPVHTYSNNGVYTVTLTATGITGCSAAIIKKDLVTVSNPVISFPGLPAKGCVPFTYKATASITNNPGIVAYLWNFGDGTTATGATPSHTYTKAGTYEVSLTITRSDGCTQKETVKEAVKVGQKPVISIAASANPVCASTPVGFTYTASATPDKWQWFFGDGGTAAVPQPAYKYADTGKFLVRLVTETKGCVSEDTLPALVTVIAPVARFASTFDCEKGLQVKFEDQSIYNANSTPLSWLWNFGDGTTSTEQHPVHLYAAEGTYNINLNITNAGCSDLFASSIKIFNETPDFTTPATEVCLGTGVSFGAITKYAANVTAYTWDFGNGNTGGSDSPVTTYAKPGTYPVTLKIAYDNGCIKTITKADYIKANGPSAQFNSSDNGDCKGLNTFFKAVKTDAVNWQWDFGDGNGLSQKNEDTVKHTYSDTGLYHVQLTVSDSRGCRDSLVTIFTAAPQPKADFTSLDTITCLGHTSRFINTSVATAQYSSKWNLGNGHTATTTDASTLYNNRGRYQIQLKITDIYGCTDSVSKESYVMVSGPQVSFTVSDTASFCIPFSVNFKNTSAKFKTISWDINGTSMVGNEPVQLLTKPDTYIIKLIAKDSVGCTDSVDKKVVLYDASKFNVNYIAAEGCKPITLSLSAGSEANQRFVWDFGDGVIKDTATSTITHTYNSLGSFIPKTIISDRNGCTITLTGKTPIKIFGISSKFDTDKKILCDSGYIRFTDSSFSNDVIKSYRWDFGDGTQMTLPVATGPVHFYKTPGLYKPSINISTQKGCTDSFTLTVPVVVTASPVIDFGPDTSICLNDYFYYKGKLTNADTAAITWRWQLPNGLTSSLKNPPAQQFKQLGTFPVSLFVTNSSGCTDSAAKNILINPLPVIKLPGTITQQIGFPTLINASYSPGTVKYSWQPALSLNCSDCATPYATPKMNTLYTVTATDRNGCHNSGQVQVIVFCKNSNVFVPNTFSPNGDGINDIFYVRGRGLDRVKSLRIFDRWGQVIFERTNFSLNDTSVGWDGRSKGASPVPGVYIYQIEVFCDNGETIKFDGNVTLIQ